MSLSITIKTMLEAGCSAEQLAQVVLAHEREADETKKEKRAKRAAQKRLERERRLMSPNVAATSSDNVRHEATTCDISSPSSPSPDGFPPALYKNNTTPLPITPTSTPSPRSNRGHRLPDDWFPSMEDHSFADRLGVVGEVDKFRDHWHSQPGQKGTKVDWSATWRNWCRRAAERKPVAKTSPELIDPFPETGTIRYSPWAAKVRDLGTGRDPDWIADQFRTWAKSKNIDFSNPHLGKMFYSFAKAQKPI